MNTKKKKSYYNQNNGSSASFRFLLVIHNPLLRVNQSFAVLVHILILPNKRLAL